MATRFYLSIFKGPEIQDKHGNLTLLSKLMSLSLQITLHLISSLEQRLTSLQRQTYLEVEVRQIACSSFWFILPPS